MDVYDLSFREAQEIARNVPEAVLIGGWAVWCYNPRLKSRDIDVLIAPSDVWRLANHLRSRGFAETSGAHLDKLGFRLLHEGSSIDVDAYAHTLGPFRVEDLLPKSGSRSIGGTPMKVLQPTELFALKVLAANDRRGSEKGVKDLSDLLALLDEEGATLDWNWLEERVPRRTIRDVLRTAFSDFRTTSRFYPLSMEKYRRMKRDIAPHL